MLRNRTRKSFIMLALTVPVEAGLSMLRVAVSHRACGRFPSRVAIFRLTCRTAPLNIRASRPRTDFFWDEEVRRGESAIHGSWYRRS